MSNSPDFNGTQGKSKQSDSFPSYLLGCLMGAAIVTAYPHVVLCFNPTNQSSTINSSSRKYSQQSIDEAALQREYELRRVQLENEIALNNERLKIQQKTLESLAQTSAEASRATSSLGIQAVQSFWQRPAHDPSLIEAARGR